MNEALMNKINMPVRQTAGIENEGAINKAPTSQVNQGAETRAKAGGDEAKYAKPTNSSIATHSVGRTNPRTQERNYIPDQSMRENRAQHGHITGTGKMRGN